jgi:hypothetical protein
MPSKKGGGIVEGLWAGTGFFAAMNSRTYAGFLATFAVYAVALIAAMLVLGWVVRMVTGMERFSVAEIQCQAGETPTDNCYGEKGCAKPSGACYKLLSTETD